MVRKTNETKRGMTPFWESNTEVNGEWNDIETKSWCVEMIPILVERIALYIRTKASLTIRNKIDTESLTWETVAIAHFYQNESLRVEPWTFAEMLRLSKTTDCAGFAMKIGI